MKRLYRSQKDRKLAGICGGLGEYLDLDPTLVRIAWATFSFAGPGILAYIIAWIIVPEEQVDATYQKTTASEA